MYTSIHDVNIEIEKIISGIFLDVHIDIFWMFILTWLKIGYEIKMRLIVISNYVFSCRLSLG